MTDSSAFAEQEYWVIWNGSIGIVDTVTVGAVEVTANGRHAWLDEPYDMVGPFSLDELETSGRIAFAACLVMSRQRWQEDQVALRRESYNQRQASQQRLFEEFARFSQRRESRPTPFQQHSDKKHRESLNLPVDGLLEPAQIKAAYRKLAQKVHPDVGGSHEQFVRITEARDALLERAP